MKLKECENFWILGAFLGAVGLVSALVLALVSSLTAPAIARADQRAKSAALRQLIPDFDNDPAAEVLKLDGVAFMAARRGAYDFTGRAKLPFINRLRSALAASKCSFKASRNSSSSS